MGFMAQDHDRLDLIFKEFRSQENTNFAEAEKSFTDFKAGLERHIVWEEEILFPIFEKRTGMHNDGPTHVMRMEHRQIKDYLEKIRSKLATHDTATTELETGLMEVLTAHNQKEEAVLYPWFDSSLSAKEQEETLTRMRA